MKPRNYLVSTCSLITCFSISTAISMIPTTASAQVSKSLLDNDPDVIYLNNYVAKPIKFISIEDASIYSSKKGKSSRRLGSFKAGSELVLVAMTENAYRVSGKGKHGKITGWVSPKKLSNKDPEFIKNLKYLYDRQKLIKTLIANKEVAIGMTINEVTQSLGAPTKKTSKITKEGRTGSWEFTVFEEKKHYNYLTDSLTGNVYKKFSHSTVEEKSKTTVEFENNVVSSISMTEDSASSRVRIINPPRVYRFF